MTDEVKMFVEYQKRTRPSIYIKEIRAKLIKGGICTRENVPCVSLINRCLKHDLGFTFKRLTQVPEEATRPNHDALVVNYLATMTNYCPRQMHFLMRRRLLQLLEIGIMATAQLVNEQLKFKDMQVMRHLR